MGKQLKYKINQVVHHPYHGYGMIIHADDKIKGIGWDMPKPYMVAFDTKNLWCSEYELQPKKEVVDRRVPSMPEDVAKIAEIAFILGNEITYQKAEVEKKDAEIERLKGVIELAFDEGFRLDPEYGIGKAWDEFQQKHKL